MWAPLAVALAMSLAAAPNASSRKTQLKVEVQPETAILYVDGKRKGKGGKLYTFNVSPGAHRIKVQNKGDEHQEVVRVKRGEVKTYKWAFEDDRRDSRVATRTEKDEPKVQEAAAAETSEALEVDPDLEAEQRLSDAFAPPPSR